MLERGKLDESLNMSNGGKLDLREDLSARRRLRRPLARSPKRCAPTSATATWATFRSTGYAPSWSHDFGEKPLDIVVHSLANAPDIKKRLLDTPRSGYLTARLGERVFDDLAGEPSRALNARPGRRSCRSPTWRASASSPATAAACRRPRRRSRATRAPSPTKRGSSTALRVNTISAGALASRAATAIGIIDEMIEYCRETGHSPK